MTTGTSFSIIHDQMVRDHAWHMSVIVLLKFYALHLAGTGKISEVKESIGLYLSAPVMRDAIQDLMPRTGLSEDDAERVVEELLPDYIGKLLASHIELEQSLPPDARGVSKLLLNTDFAV